MKGDNNRKEARKEYKKIKKQTDYFFAFKYRIRKTVAKALARKGYSKKTKSFEIIGIGYEDLKNYLLKTYKNNYGIEWDGIESVHIDHIIPLSTAKSEEDVFKLCHYTNLQLLKAEDNMKKNDILVWNLDSNI